MSIIFLRPEKFGITGLFGIFVLQYHSNIFNFGGELSDRKRQYDRRRVYRYARE